MNKILLLKYLCFTLFIIGSCQLAETNKPLNQKSQAEIDLIINELKLDNFEYSFHRKTKNGQSTSFFSVKLYNLKDSVDFSVYNDRIIDAFEMSGYDFSNQDFIRISYFKSLFALRVYNYYEIDPKARLVIRQGTQ